MRSMVSREEFAEMLKAESPTAEHSLDEWTPERVLDNSNRGQMLVKGWIEATRVIANPSNQLYAAWRQQFGGESPRTGSRWRVDVSTSTGL
jgi:hypothetical protein